MLFQFLCLVAILILPGCTRFRGVGENAAYEQYVGEYALDENTTAIVRADQGRLMAKISGQDYFELFRHEGDAFFYKVVDAQVMFRRCENGEVSGFWLRQNNKDYEFHRRSKNVPEDFSQRVDAGGYEVRVMIRGRGSPPVVFDGGLGESLDAWEKVTSQVVEFAQVVAYDRSGLGLSGRSSEPRTAENVARDLHYLLRNAGINGPYILVGNSAGALYLRVFAHTYPSEVSGLVLVEPSSEEYEDWLRRSHPEALKAAENELQHSAPGFRDHAAEWDRSLEQVRAAWPLPSVPVVVLTGLRHDPDDKEKREMWLQMHRRLVDRIPGATHIISTNSAHGLASSEPELVVRAVRDVFEKVTGSSRD